MKPVPHVLTVAAARDLLKTWFADDPPGAIRTYIGTYFVPGVLMARWSHLPVNVHAILPEPPDDAPPVAPPELAELNARFLIARNYGCGVPVVFVVEHYEGDPHPTLHRVTMHEFNRLLRGRKAPDGIEPLAEWYLMHPHRQRFERLLFLPMAEEGEVE